jgi:hypothetical protein
MSWGVIYELNTHNATTLARGGLSKDKAYQIYNKLAEKEQTNLLDLLRIVIRLSLSGIGDRKMRCEHG